MNQFFQNNLITIIVFLLLLVFVLMGSMIFILFRLLTSEKSKESLNSTDDQNIPGKFQFLKPIETKVTESFYCIHHPETPSSGTCLICEDVFCDNCLIDHESMHFCKEHFRIFAGHKWQQITDVRTTPDTPEEGLYIHNFKRDLWKNKNIPTFVMTHYKINLENDFIESFIQLNVKIEDVEKLTNEIQKYKAQD